MWLCLSAWEKNAEELGRYRKGDALSVAGKLTLRVWTPPNGERREDLTLTVEHLVGARPKVRKRQDGVAKPKDKPQPAYAWETAGDDLPF